MVTRVEEACKLRLRCMRLGGRSVDRVLDSDLSDKTGLGVMVV